MSTPRRAPSVAACSLLLLGVRLRLKVCGFGRSLAAVRRRGERWPAVAARDTRLVEECTRTVTLAAAFFPGRAICLEQALALFLVLRRRGVPAEIRVGVQPYPFAAHAWVELDGAAVNEDEEFVRQFVVMPGVAR